MAYSLENKLSVKERQEGKPSKPHSYTETNWQTDTQNSKQTNKQTDVQIRLTIDNQTNVLTINQTNVLTINQTNVLTINQTNVLTTNQTNICIFPTLFFPFSTYFSNSTHHKISLKRFPLYESVNNTLTVWQLWPGPSSPSRKLPPPTHPGSEVEIYEVV